MATPNYRNVSVRTDLNSSILSLKVKYMLFEDSSHFKINYEIAEGEINGTYL
jgi:hypothetical protein